MYMFLGMNTWCPIIFGRGYPQGRLVISPSAIANYPQLFNQGQDRVRCLPSMLACQLVLSLLGLGQATTVLKFHGCCFSIVSTRQNLTTDFLVLIAILTQVRWNFSFICIPPMIRYVEHFFHVSWAFVLHLLRTSCSFHQATYQLGCWGVFGWVALGFHSSLYMMYINLLSENQLTKIYPILQDVSSPNYCLLCYTELSIFIEPYLSFFVSFSELSGSFSESPCFCRCV